MHLEKRNANRLLANLRAVVAEASVVDKSGIHSDRAIDKENVTAIFRPRDEAPTARSRNCPNFCCKSWHNSDVNPGSELLKPDNVSRQVPGNGSCAPLT